MTRRPYLVLPLLALALGVGACAPVKGAGPVCSPSPNLAREVFDAVNEDRAAHHVAPVTWDADLATQAQVWAEHLARIQGLLHNNSGADNVGGPGFCLTTGRAVEKTFYGSIRHRTNLLNPAWTRLGIGIAYDAHSFLWDVQQFG